MHPFKNMAIEIERKFLLLNSDWRKAVYDQKKIFQGYLSSNPERTVRVRVSDQKGIITIKGKSQGNSRAEYEYNIPLTDADELIKLCENPIISKTRYLVKIEEKVWEIDEFSGENQGLIVAEVELQSETERITFPSWIGKEVSSEKRFFNASLIKYPYSEWTDKEKQFV